MANTDQDIKDALTKYKNIAVIGLSPDPGRPSFGVTRYMIDAGYIVTGVRPGVNEILGRPCVKALGDVRAPVEIVDVFRASENVPAIVDDAILAKAKVLWLQEGVTHPAAEEKARMAGLIVISDRCILKEHRRIVRANA